MTDSTRYDSDQYLEEYYKTGRFPKIHDDIVTLAMNCAMDNDPCIDLGCCTGLLSVRLVKEVGRSLCIGIEGNERLLEKAIRHDKVMYENFYITDETIPRLIELIKKYQVNLIIARRVLPEIAGEDKSVVKRLAKALHEVGLRRLIIEGRVKVKGAVSPLPDIEAEVAALSPYYWPGRVYKDCRLMIHNGGKAVENIHKKRENLDTPGKNGSAKDNRHSSSSGGNSTEDEVCPLWTEPGDIT